LTYKIIPRRIDLKIIFLDVFVCSLIGMRYWCPDATGQPDASKYEILL
jgi:hypothetical protein